jgi:hypothetical protein
MTVTGRNFTPKANVVVTFVQGSTRTSRTTAAGADGTFSVTFTIPSWAVVGPASVSGCDTACAFAPVTVTS